MKNGSRTAHEHRWPARTTSREKQPSFLIGYLFLVFHEAGVVQYDYLLVVNVIGICSFGELGNCLPQSRTW